SKIDFEIAAREESLWAELAMTGPEPLKAEVNREVGKRVSDHIRKEAALDRPDVVAVLDTAFDHVDLQVNPLYLRGRYRKLSRGVPQTRWPCRRCRGKGCDRCRGTGKMYPTSVEEVIAAEIMRESGGTGHALHGMGREDVDARMLGRGRDPSAHAWAGRSPTRGYHTGSTVALGRGRRYGGRPGGTPGDRGGRDLHQGMGPRRRRPDAAVPRGTARRGVRGARARRARRSRRRVRRWSRPRKGSWRRRGRSSAAALASAGSPRSRGRCNRSRSANA